MKFCRHCGTQLPDNAVCNCPDAVAERQAQGGFQQPPRQPLYGQSPYGQQPQPSQQPQPPKNPQTPQPPRPPYQGNPDFNDAQKMPPRQENGFGKKLIEPFTLLFKDPKKAVNNRIKDKDIATPLIYTGALFLAVLAACNCVYGTHAFKGILVPGDTLSMGKGMVAYNFGLAFLAAFLLTVGMAATYVGARFLILLLCGKKGKDPVQLLTESLISFGVNSVIPMGLILLGGLFYMVSSLFGWVFFILTAFWYAVSCLLEIRDDFDPQGNPFLRLLIVAGITGGSVALFLLLYQGMFAMNVRIISEFAAEYELRIQRSLTGGNYFYY